MSQTRTGIIIGVLVAAVVTLGIVVGVMAMSGGDDAPATENLANVVKEADVAPTPTTIPTPIPTLTPTPPPPPPPTPAPEVRTCDAIRADPEYRSPEEQAFFRNVCALTPVPGPARTGGQPAAPPAPTQPPAGPSGPTVEEQAYTRRASQVNLEYVAKLSQYWNTPSLGGLNDLYDLSAIALNHANALNAIQPVPARFRPAHDTLVRNLLAFRDHILTIERVSSQSQFITWVGTYERLADNLNTSLAAWQLAVGVQVISLGGLR